MENGKHLLEPQVKLFDSSIFDFDLDASINFIFQEIPIQKPKPEPKIDSKNIILF